MSRTIQRIPENRFNYPNGWIESKATTQSREFATRFRIAKSFDKIDMDKCVSESTGAGYTALLRLMLVYSAYERFSNYFGLKADKKRMEIEANYRNVETIRSVRKVQGGCCKLLDFLSKKSKSKTLKENAKSILRKNDGSIILLAESIRHLFAHGNLTPNTWGEDPRSVKEACDLLSDALLSIMDNETGPRMENINCK